MFWSFALFFSSMLSSNSYAIPVQRQQSRSALIHPSAKHSVHLFHGTFESSLANNILKVGFDVNKSGRPEGGDFHRSPVHAGYMTDSIYAAAQFVCHAPDQDDASTQTSAYVVEFSWDGDEHVQEFTAKDNSWIEFQMYNIDTTGTETKPASYDGIMAKTMVTGPMDLSTVFDDSIDDHLTESFWQYAIIAHQNPQKKYTYSDKLKPLTVHEVYCDHVPIGNALTDKMYAMGQQADSDFEATVRMLTTKTKKYPEHFMKDKVLEKTNRHTTTIEGMVMFNTRALLEHSVKSKSREGEEFEPQMIREGPKNKKLSELVGVKRKPWSNLDA
ncbi:hypothetical protein EV368DRAFT_64748 [Lentinula lateritia]|nr:hypothetical protein EV368DRAFT_64748 [Lentinula lateritia]